MQTNQRAIGKSEAWLHELLSDLLAIIRPLSELAGTWREDTFDTVAQRWRPTIITAKNDRTQLEQCSTAAIKV